MRVGVKDVKLPLGIVLDKWEVLLGGGLACVAVGVAAESARFLLWLGVGLIVLWVVTVFLVNLGILKPREASEEGGGSAPVSTPKEAGGSTRPKP